MSLTDLPYPVDFLSEVLPERIVQIHHDNHHKGYLTKLNEFIDKNMKYNATYLKDLVKGAWGHVGLERYAGGLYNHYLYWWTLTASNCTNGAPIGKLLTDIISKWGTFEVFQSRFDDLAKVTFGNGWTWLCVDKTGLQLLNSYYQLSPLMNTGDNICYPVLGIDLWEHSYYLKYTSDRDAYISDFWKIVDWDIVEYFYEKYASELTAVPF
ncbi:hypothetical protein SteCoe_32041 [Stentor coeruleus]|uniref:Superoxide dismutase n=1 Tax=Stentor coeruleus TaxID=5963 RepID=A0A1R2AZY3_9CILI|nr:hypothetical protein SteCoe_32041 [Stentor coeruleus]